MFLSPPEDDVVVIRRHNLLCNSDGSGGVLSKNPRCSLSRRSGLGDVGTKESAITESENIANLVKDGTSDVTMFYMHGGEF